MACSRTPLRERMPRVASLPRLRLSRMGLHKQRLFLLSLSLPAIARNSQFGRQGWQCGTRKTAIRLLLLRNSSSSEKKATEKKVPDACNAVYTYVGVVCSPFCCLFVDAVVVVVVSAASRNSALRALLVCARNIVRRALAATGDKQHTTRSSHLDVCSLSG